MQSIRTLAFSGPNEIQEIVTAATPSDEVQAIVTSLTQRSEVQAVTTTAAMGETLTGSFTLKLDMRPFGGGVYTSGNIPFDAPATIASAAGVQRTSMQEKLQAVPGVGLVNATRVGPDDVGGYTWTITFLGLQGNVPAMQLGSSSLNSIGAAVRVHTIEDGQALGGTFTLALEGQRTSALPFDATAGEMQTALEALSNVDAVVVAREGPSMRNEYTWFVTFTGFQVGGNVPALVANASLLQGLGAAVTVCDATSAAATAACAHVTPLVRDGNELGGTFSISGSVPLSVDASAADVKLALEAAAGGSLGTVDVTRAAGPDRQGGYTWRVTFTSAQGPQPMLVSNATALTGNGATATVARVSRGTQRARQNVSLPLIGGAGSAPVGHLLWSVTGSSAAAISIPFSGSAGCAALPASVVEAALERLPEVVGATVSCADTGASLEYGVEFSNAGPVALLNVSTNASTGVSTPVVVEVQAADGVPLSGQFSVLFGGQRSRYLSFDADAAEVRSALSALTSLGDVEVHREGPTADNGYTWLVTFLTDVGDVPAMTVDGAALLGTWPAAVVREERKGVLPPFNGGVGGQPYGTVTLADPTALSYTMDGVLQGIPFYVRVAAYNAHGYSEFAYAYPLGIVPHPLAPSAPVAAALTSSVPRSVTVTFSAPTQDGGAPVDAYLVELDTAPILSEVQAVTVGTLVQNEVQSVATSATDVDEVQIVQTVGTSAGVPAVTEVQTLSCDAVGGSLTLTFRGYTTAPRAAASAAVSVAFQAMGAVVYPRKVSVREPPTASHERVCTSVTAGTPAL
ncbi:hypothetical protein EON62_01115, partial [archaeon]